MSTETRSTHAPERAPRPPPGRLAPFTLSGRTVPVAVLLTLVPLGFAVLALRRVDTLAHPQLWAEDGPVFLRDAYLHSWPSSLFRPYAGYLHLLLRVWAELTTLLPVHRLPLSYAVFALGTTVACFSLVLSRRLRWVIPSDGLRIVAFFVLIALPAREEITGNLTNAIWPVAIALIIMSLWDSPVTAPGRGAEAAAVVTLGLSGASSLLVWPAFWLRRRRQAVAHNTLIAALATASAAVQGLIVVLSDQRTNEGLGKVGDMALALFVRIWGTMTLGERLLTGALAERPVPVAVWILAGVALAVTGLALFAVPGPLRVTLVTTFVLTSGAALWILDGKLVRVARSTEAGRYFVIQIALVALLWLACLPRVRRLGRGPAAAVVAPALALLAFACAQDFLMPRQPRVDWAPMAECLAAYQPCEIKMNPQGFDFNLPPIPNVRP